MATATLKISGVAHPFMAGTMRITRRVHGRGTASFVVVDKGALQHFAFNEPCVVLGLDGTTPEFTGWLDSIEETSWHTENGVSDGLVHRITCKDNHYLLDKRVVKSDQYRNMTAGAIVQQIITDVLSQEGVTAGTIQAGALVKRLPADVISAAELIEKLADQSNYIYRINNDRSLDFRARTHVSASVASLGTGMLRGTVKVRRRNFSYRNKQWVVGSDPATRPQYLVGNRAVFSGDGTTRQWDLVQHAVGISSIRFSSDAGATWSALRTAAAVEDPTDFSAATTEYQWRMFGTTLYQDPASPVLALGEAIQVTMWSYSSIATGDIPAATGTTQYMNGLGRQQPFQHAMVEVDRGLGFVIEPLLQSTNPADKSGATDWWHETFSPAQGSGSYVWEYVGASPPVTGDTIRITMGSFGAVDIAQENASEIARNKAIEGNTTSGIVEAVINAMQAESDAEAAEAAKAELNRWSHDTLEIEYATWDGRLVDGEVATVDLPDHGIDMEKLLIDEITITDRPTQGTENAKDSPLIYRVSTISSPTGLGGADVGSIGRATNPHRFSDLVRQLNDRVRIPTVRTLSESTTLSIVTVSIGTFLGTATMSAQPPALPDPILHVVGDDYTALGDGAGIPDLLNRITTEPDLRNRSFGSPDWYALVETTGPNGHTSIFFEDFDGNEEQDWYSNDAIAPFPDPFGLDGTSMTIFLVMKLGPFEQFESANAWFLLGENHELFYVFADDGVTQGDGRFSLQAGAPFEFVGFSGGPVAGEWALHTVTKDNGLATIRINGTQVASGNMVLSNGPLDEVHLGNFSLRGDSEIAEYRIYEDLLDATELALVEAALMSTYGITP